MRLGLISDIHGNLLALDAVLAEIEREDLDRLVCLGDVVAGPRANDALARILNRRAGLIGGKPLVDVLREGGEEHVLSVVAEAGRG